MPGVNGSNIIGQNPPTLLVSFFIRLHVAKSLTGFKLCATTPNITQQHATGVQMAQHVTFNNVGSCWPTILRPFAPGFKCTIQLSRRVAIVVCKRQAVIG